MNLRSLKANLDSDGIIFCFSGAISHEILTSISGGLEKTLEQLNVSTSVIQSVFAIFVEQMQNMMHYSADKTTFSFGDEIDKEALQAEIRAATGGTCDFDIDDDIESNKKLFGNGICIVGYSKTRHKYFIASGNLMNNKHREKLTEKLDKVRTLDKEELKAHYKELRRSGEGVHSFGAGLGFVEMQRRASEPLEYNVEPITEDNSFFSLTFYI